MSGLISDDVLVFFAVVYAKGRWNNEYLLDLILVFEGLLLDLR